MRPVLHLWQKKQLHIIRRHGQILSSIVLSRRMRDSSSASRALPRPGELVGPLPDGSRAWGVPTWWCGRPLSLLLFAWAVVATRIAVIGPTPAKTRFLSREWRTAGDIRQGVGRNLPAYVADYEIGTLQGFWARNETQRDALHRAPERPGLSPLPSRLCELPPCHKLWGKYWTSRNNLTKT